MDRLLQKVVKLCAGSMVFVVGPEALVQKALQKDSRLVETPAFDADGAVFLHPRNERRWPRELFKEFLRVAKDMPKLVFLVGEGTIDEGEFRREMECRLLDLRFAADDLSSLTDFVDSVT